MQQQQRRLRAYAVRSASCARLWVLCSGSLLNDKWLIGYLKIPNVDWETFLYWWRGATTHTKNVCVPNTPTHKLRAISRAHFSCAHTFNDWFATPGPAPALCSQQSNMHYIGVYAGVRVCVCAFVRVFVCVCALCNVRGVIICKPPILYKLCPHGRIWSLVRAP